MQWQNLFKGHILDRGLNYFQNGYVSKVTETDDGYEAWVNGSEEYYVHITIEDGEICDMTCTCPYAEGGQNCKHMAAALFQIDDRMNNDTDRKNSANFQNEVNAQSANKNTDTQNKIDELVKNTDEAIVRDFLADVLKNNDKLLSRFKNAVCKDVSDIDIKQYKKQIDRIFYEYKGRDGFISYYNASGFISELLEFISEDIRQMLDNEEYAAAFKLSTYLFVKAGNVDIDDSDGGTGEIADECASVWNEILEDCNDKQVEKMMFQWFMKHLNGTVIDYMEEYLEQTLFDNFKEDEYLKEKLKLTDKRISDVSKAEDEWNSRFQMEKWAENHIQLLMEMKADKTEIEEFCQKYWHVKGIRERAVNECISHRDYERAIEILKESKELDKEWPGLVCDYSRKLKDLYKQTGNESAYREELWKLMVEYDKGNLDIFRELKSLYSEVDWQNEREKIFKAAQRGVYGTIERLYLEEKMYKNLLLCVTESTGLYELNEYEKVLKPLYENELLEKYKKEVCSMALHTSDRKHYREIVSVLMRMGKYKNGKAAVTNIIDDWKVRYRNRKAMMEELGKIRL